MDSMEVGNKYNRFTILALSKEKGKKVMADVACDCGHKQTVSLSNIKAGRPAMCLKCSYVKRGQESVGKLRRYDDHTAARDTYSDRKNRAIKQSRTYNLSFEEFYEIAKRNCFYCGSEPSNCNKALTPWAQDFIYNGLDRVDSSRGYEPDNVVACCWKCNYMKRDLSVFDFFSHIEKIVTRNNLTV